MNGALARTAKGLGLAATPTFAAMAAATAVWGGGPVAALCGASPGFGLDGMTQMYLLMAAFHVPPWLRLASRRTR